MASPKSRLEYRAALITGGAVDTPEMFFGREDVLEFLKENLLGKYQNNVIILQGNRRTGKSSVLKQVVRQELFNPHLPVYIDCQGLGSSYTAAFFYKIAREIWKAARKAGIDDVPDIKRADISTDDPFYDFRDYLDNLTLLMPGRKVILLIDEFEVIDQEIRRGRLDEMVLPNLRHLFQHRHDVAVVLTGSYQLNRLREEYWSVLFGIGKKHRIDVLDEESARRLVVEPVEDKVQFEEVVDYVIQLTACQPYFIQTLCHDVVNTLNRLHTNYVTRAIVDEAAELTLISADGHLKYMFDSSPSASSRALLVYMGTQLEENEMVTLSELEGVALENRLPISVGEIEEQLRDMVERDVLEVGRDERDGRYYYFKTDLVRRWIARNHDLQWAIKQARESKVIREE